VAEDHGSDRAGNETDGVDGERLQHADKGIGFREEQLAEDQASNRAVEQEIVPFDRRAHRAGDNGAAQLGVVIGFRQGMSGDVDRRHGASPWPGRTLFRRPWFPRCPAGATMDYK
jgi:hypothetical protein